MTKRRFIRAFIGLIFVMSVTFVFAAQPQWKGTITKEGDVVIVKNPKEPIYKDEILSIKEDFSIGGAEAKAEYILTSPSDIAIDNNGNLYVLDSRESCIKVFSPSAKYIRTIGRRGQGPGEWSGGFSLTLLLDKEEIFVYDGQVSVFKTNGTYLNRIRVRGFAGLVKVDSSRNIYVLITEFLPGVRQDVLNKMNPDASRVLAEIIRHPTDESRNPFTPRDCWILDGQDRLIFGEGKTYEIRYFSPDGGLARKIDREYEPLKITTKDMDEFESRKTPPGIVLSRKTINYSTHHAAYRSFFADDQGHLFVQTWERTPDNRQDIHDIFDADGRFIGRVALSRHSDLINPKPRFIRAGKLYTIEPDKEGYEVVKRYSVEWLNK